MIEAMVHLWANNILYSDEEKSKRLFNNIPRMLKEPVMKEIKERNINYYNKLTKGD